jgi:Icc-related predicted phosphoesterase
MRIRLLSDLHAEGGFNKELYKSQGEDVLILAGDINVGANAVWTMLKQFAEYQPNIVYVTGNHEYYKQDYFQTNSKLEDWCKYTSIKFLNPGTVHFDPKLKKFQQSEDSIAIIGGCLWTNFRNNELSKISAVMGINDFRLIEFDNHYFSPEDAAKLFEQHSLYIKLQTEKIKTKKLIVTHFLPAVECIDPQYLGAGSSPLNDYFASDLGDWISQLEDTTWLFGHTHSNVDITLGTTRVIANPYGYGKNPNYKECLIDL